MSTTQEPILDEIQELSSSEFSTNYKINKKSTENIIFVEESAFIYIDGESIKVKNLPPFDIGVEFETIKDNVELFLLKKFSHMKKNLFVMDMFNYNKKKKKASFRVGISPTIESYYVGKTSAEYMDGLREHAEHLGLIKKDETLEDIDLPIEEPVVVENE